MKNKEIIEQEFIKFSKKSIDELTAKEEDFLLELWKDLK